MNNTMKKLTAAVLALACAPITGLTAIAVEMPWYWGETTWSAFEDAEPINDHGMLTGNNGGTVYVGNHENDVICVNPRYNIMKFVLRDHTDKLEAAKQIAEVLEQYYPGIQEGFEKEHYETYGAIQYGTDSVVLNWDSATEDKVVFELWATTVDRRFKPDDSDNVETGILLELAKRHLISEFYGWGETALYHVCYAEKDVLSGFWERSIDDWDSVQTYLESNHPEYTLERYQGQLVSYRADDGTILTSDQYYRIAGTENLSFREKVELGGELYEHSGLVTNFYTLEAAPGSTTGHNALERPGDTNLDCEVDILDVISMNKYIVGAKDLDKTELKNADLNGDGAADSQDSLSILKTVLSSGH
ncbi:MAG: dockerin type I repeat-containing protein [Oscillospiraceae bacterium]|nr:dockerin type I repeat-containing protein [Oscillospiraceae bacterium]